MADKNQPDVTAERGMGISAVAQQTQSNSREKVTLGKSINKRLVIEQGTVQG